MLIKNNYDNLIEFRAAQTIFGRPIYLTHFYFFDGLLIDTGPHHICEEVLEAVKMLPVEQVVITHRHEDHTGNCAVIKDELHVPIYAHTNAAAVLADPPPIEIYRKIMWGSILPVDILPVPDKVITNNFELQAIYTAGHSRDHMCYFEPENRLLFSGDFYLGESLNSFMVGENITEHLVGLQKIIALNPKTLFCGLKGKLDNATERLERKYESWYNLCFKVRDMYLNGASMKLILQEAFGGEILFFYFSQSNWGRRYMLESIINNLTFFQDKSIKESLPASAGQRSD